MLTNIFLNDRYCMFAIGVRPNSPPIFFPQKNSGPFPYFPDIEPQNIHPSIAVSGPTATVSGATTTVAVIVTTTAQFSSLKSQVVAVGAGVGVPLGLTLACSLFLLYRTRKQLLKAVHGAPVGPKQHD